MTAREWALLVALATVWGGSFFFAKIAVLEWPPLTVALARVGLAAAALLTVLRAMGETLRSGRRVWCSFAAMGALNNAIPFSLLFWGQTEISSALASILNATTPVFTVLLAHVLTRDERLSPLRAAGTLLGVGGVAVMVGLAALDDFGRNVAAQVACLGAAASYALAGIYGRRFRGLGVTPLATAAGQLGASTVLLALPVLIVDRPWALMAPSWQAAAALVALALIGTAFAYILYFRILATAGATNLSLVTLLIPAYAILLGAGVLGETIEPRHWWGLALIALGLIAIDGRALAWLRRAVGAEWR